MTLKRSPRAPQSQLNLLLPCQVAYYCLDPFLAPFLHQDRPSFPGCGALDALPAVVVHPRKSRQLVEPGDQLVCTVTCFAQVVSRA